MTPTRTATDLRDIADAIDRARNPDRDLVIAAVRRVIAAISPVDQLVKKALGQLIKDKKSTEQVDIGLGADVFPDSAKDMSEIAFTAENDQSVPGGFLVMAWEKGDHQIIFEGTFKGSKLDEVVQAITEWEAQFEGGGED